MFESIVGSVPVSPKRRRLAAALSAVVHFLLIGIAVAVAFVHPRAWFITPPCAETMTTHLIFRLPSLRPPLPPSTQNREASAPMVAFRRASAAVSDLAVPIADAEGDNESARSAVTELVAGQIGGVCGCGVLGGLVGGMPAFSLPPVDLDLPPLPAAALRVGGGVSTPVKVIDVQPKYPPLARHAGIEGVVVLDATIDETGRVVDVRVLRSISALDRAAIEAVRKWRSAPVMVNGRAVPVLMTVTARFVL